MSRGYELQSHKKLYAILRELDCELQMLGARSDEGIFATPNFARHTLRAALVYLSRDSAASDDYLEDTAREILSVLARRKQKTEYMQAHNITECGGIRCASEMEKADTTNSALFAKLFREYVAGFQDPVERTTLTTGFIA